MRTNAEIERVVNEYATMLLRVAYSQLNNRAEAEDAVQEVLLKYMEKAPEFQGEEHEKAWLIVTARNECRGQLKHWWRTRREDGAVLEAAIEMAKKIKAKGPVAVTLAKQAINVGANTDLYSGLCFERYSQAIAFSTADKAEGTLAFIEKRPAQFKGV